MSKLLNKYRRALDFLIFDPMLKVIEYLTGQRYCDKCSDPFEPLNKDVAYCDSCTGEYTYKCNGCTDIFETDKRMNEDEALCDECFEFECFRYHEDIKDKQHHYYNG